MKIKFLCILLVVIFIFPLKTLAQDKGYTLISKLYNSPNNLPIKDLVAEIEVYNNVKNTSSLQLSGKDKLIFKKPNKLRIDCIISEPGSALDGQPLTIIRDGMHRWMYIPVGQMPLKKGRDKPSPTLLLPPNIQNYSIDSGNRYKLIGFGRVNKIKSYVVRIKRTTGERKYIWIDPKKWVPLKMKIKIPNKKAPSRYTLKTCIYRDFKKIKDGRWFPTIIEIKKDGKIITLVKYKSISVNVGLRDDLFKPMRKFIK